MWGFLWRHPGLPTFTFRGIRVYLHPSIVYPIIVYSGLLAATRFFGRYPALSQVTIMFMIFSSIVLGELSILLHEFGHSLRAQREGLVSERISLWGFGGVSWSQGARTPGSDFRVVLAGPLVSLALALLCGGAGWLGHRVGAPAAVEGVVILMAQFNAVMLAFNLIPVVPLDGGRMLLAGLWRWRGRPFAHKWACAVGITIAGGMIAFGVVAPFLGLSAQLWDGRPVSFSVLITACLLAYATTRFRSAYGPAAGPTPRHMVVGDLAVDPEVAPEPAAHHLGVAAYLALATDATVYGTAASPVLEDGRTVGVISRGLAALVPAGERSQTRLSTAMLRVEDAVVLHPDTPIVPAFNQLQSAGGRGVIMKRGRVKAIILASDLADLILRAQDRARGVNPAPVSRVAHR